MVLGEVMYTARCKNLSGIFRRHVRKGNRPGEAYAYSISISSLEDVRKEQVQEIKKLNNLVWPLTPSKRMDIEDKVKMLEESLQTIDKFMEWENKEHDGVV